MRQLRSSFFLSILIFLLACGPKSRNSEMPHVLIQTGFGDIELELYAKQAPQTVAAFLRYVDSGYYKNSQFYRVLTIDNQPSNAPKACNSHKGQRASQCSRLFMFPIMRRSPS